MPRNMSFALTEAQFRARSKTVTRRLGWANLRPGEIVMGCRKCQGLKPGEKLERLGRIQIVEVRREPLDRLCEDPAYGQAEIVREGFGSDPVLCQPQAFVEFFCRSHRGCQPSTIVTRIEYRYLDPREVAP